MYAETVNVVQLLCDLSESSDEVFHASKIGPERDNGLQYLARLGAIERGPLPETIVCDACDADHPAVIEFDESSDDQHRKRPKLLFQVVARA